MKVITKLYTNEEKTRKPDGERVFEKVETKLDIGVVDGLDDELIPLNTKVDKIWANQLQPQSGPTNPNANDYWRPGRWRWGSNASLNGALNFPIKSAGILTTSALSDYTDVPESGTWRHSWQTYEDLDGNSWVRSYSTSSNAVPRWGEWRSSGLSAYPIGSVYMSSSATNPGSLFGGTWVAMPAGRVLVSMDTSQTEFDTVLKTGGSKNVTLTTAQIPAHNHSASSNSTGGHTHTGTATSNGAHSHTASSNNTGAHTHGITVYYSTAHGANGVWGSNASGTGGTYNYARSNGAHSHTITVNSGGAHTHPVTTVSAGEHSHTITVNNAGGGGSHTNLQPYTVVYMWRRTA